MEFFWKKKKNRHLNPLEVFQLTRNCSQLFQCSSLYLNKSSPWKAFVVKTDQVTKCTFGLRVRVFQFTFSTFFFFLARICWLWETIFTVMNTHCAYTVHILKNIKNESHDTIYIFKNYFATVFSVFNNNKFNTNTPKDSKHALAWKDLRSIQFFMLIF